MVGETNAAAVEPVRSGRSVMAEEGEGVCRPVSASTKIFHCIRRQTSVVPLLVIKLISINHDRAVSRNALGPT